MNDLKQIEKLVGRTRLRLRLQQVLERATTALAVSLALLTVGLFFYKSRAVDFGQLSIFAWTAGGLLLAGAVWGLLTPIPTRYVLKRLDLAHGTRDALGSAWDFAGRLRDDNAPKQTQRALMEAQIQRSVQLLPKMQPAKASRFRMPRDLSAVGVLALCTVAFLGMTLPAKSTRASVPPVQAEPPKLRMGEDQYSEAVDDMRAVEDLARHLKDKEMLSFLKEYKKLLRELKKGELTRRQFEKKYDQLMKKYFAGQERAAKNFQELKKQLYRTGEALKKNKLTKKLGEALKKHDIEAAKRELKKLMELMKKGKLSKWQKKQLEKALKKAAKVLQNKDAKRFEQKMAEQDKKLQKKIAKTRRELQRLKRQLDKTRTQRKRAQMKRQFNKKQRELKRLQRRQKRLAQQKRTLKRLSRSMKNAANQLNRQKMDAKTRAAMQKLMKELQKYQNQSARGRGRSQAKLTLKQLKELLKRLRNQGKRQKGQLSDFLKRARGQKRGQKPCASCKGSGHKPGGKKPCPTCNGSGKKPGGIGGISLRPGGRSGGLERGGQKPGGQGGKGGKKWGTGHKPGSVKGQATNLGAKHAEKKLQGKHSKGPSEAQVFRGGANKGFTSINYRKVYLAYKKIWQKVLNQEEIPPGYRYIIQRYFRLIKPRQ